MILFGVALFAFLWCFGSVRSILAKAEGTPHRLSTLSYGAAIAAIALIAGSVAFTWSFGIAESYLGAFQGDAQTGLALLGVGAIFFVYASIAAGVAVDASGIVMLRTSTFPRWFGWVSVLSGLVITAGGIFDYALLLLGGHRRAHDGRYWDHSEGTGHSRVAGGQGARHGIQDGDRTTTDDETGRRGTFPIIRGGEEASLTLASGAWYVDSAIVWEVVFGDLPKLEGQIRQLIHGDSMIVLRTARGSLGTRRFFRGCPGRSRSTRRHTTKLGTDGLPPSRKSPAR